MLEIIYAIILSTIFFLASRPEIRFEKNRDKYIDDNKLYLPKQEAKETEEE